MFSWTAETEEQRRKAVELMETIDKVMRGEVPITLVIDDPVGNSMQVGAGAARRTLGPQEVAQLKPGAYVLDLCGR